MFQESLSSDDVNEILNCAERMWEQANKWKNKVLVSHLSNLQLYVDETNGSPVCKRFHKELISFLDRIN